MSNNLFRIGNCKFCGYISNIKDEYRTKNQCKKCYLSYCREYCKIYMVGKYQKVEVRKKRTKCFKVLFKENMPIHFFD
jgi:hypothetical protein